MTDLPSLAAALVANFRTIRLPASEDGLAKSIPTRANWLQIAKARRVDRRAEDTYRDRIRRKTIEDGYEQFLDREEPDFLMAGAARCSRSQRVKVSNTYRDA